MCAESDSDDSDQRPTRRRRVDIAQADDMSEGQVCAQHVAAGENYAYFSVCVLFL